MRSLSLCSCALAAIVASACTGKIIGPVGGDDGPTGDDDPGDPGDPPGDPIDPSFSVELVPQPGVAGVQRINFAVPLPPGLVDDVRDVRIAIGGGGELDAGRRALGAHDDGSLRSVQLQVEVDVSTVSSLDLEVGTPAAEPDLALVDVAETLVTADGTAGPRVWVRLPPAWLAATGAVGPVTPRPTMPDSLDGWAGICDYATWDVEAFLALDDDRGSWLYDRATAMYRGYAYSGEQAALESGYREAAIYRAGITGSGSSTRIGVPTSADDVKYHYSQNLAIHYLLTGDDRFREAAENVAIRMHDLWRPGYDGGFWTERNAGFALLAYEWAAMVSDDRAATFAGWADEAVDAYLAMQENDGAAWEDDARCFAHTAESHDEPFGYVGCSPWMSAILADGLDAYARRVGGADGAAARDAIARLGRMIARHGLDGDGKPYYWQGAGVDSGEIDEYEEHWGESAYVVAMAWHYGGREEDDLREAALALIDGLATRGEAGQLRSFNWQCRSGPLAPTFLRE